MIGAGRRKVPRGLLARKSPIFEAGFKKNHLSTQNLRSQICVNQNQSKIIKTDKNRLKCRPPCFILYFFNNYLVADAHAADP